MAEAKKKRILKRVETVRERSAKPVKAPKTRRLSTAGSHVKRPLRALVHIGRKEYYLPLPNNKVGTFLNKRRSFIPAFFKESWQELVQVEWPSKRTTLHLSTAVLLFAVFFGIVVAITDYGLDKLFKQLIIK